MAKQNSRVATDRANAESNRMGPYSSTERMLRTAEESQHCGHCATPQDERERLCVNERDCERMRERKREEGREEERGRERRRERKGEKK